jgi:replicative DNA helicase
MMDTSVSEVVLGMLLNDSSNLEKALASGLTVDHFSDRFYQDVFRAILRAESENLGVSLRSVSSLLPSEHRPTLLRYATEAPLVQNVGYYVSELKAQGWRQSVMRQLQDVHSRIFNAKPFEPIESLRLSVASLAQDFSTEGARKTIYSSQEVADLVLADVEARILAAKEGGLVGIPTGIKMLDRLVYGWEEGALYTLGARSRIGKTTSAVNFAVSAAESGRTTALFTVEMSAKQIGKKGTSRIGELDFSRLMSGKLPEDDVKALHASLKRMASLPIVFVEASSSFERFSADVKRLKRTHGIQFVILDYIQQMYLTERKSGSRTNELTTITSEIKWLARELSIPVLMLAQLNRKADEEDAAPNLSHLKDSGSLEQDSDTVLFLWREVDGYQAGEPQFSYWLDVAKNRHGMEGRIPLAHDLARNYFGERSP